jgi:hypothetical protein
MTSPWNSHDIPTMFTWCSHDVFANKLTWHSHDVFAWVNGLEGHCLPKLYIMCCFISRSFPYYFLKMLNLWLYCKTHECILFAIIFNLWCGFVDSCMFLSVSNWGSVWVFMEQMMQKFLNSNTSWSHACLTKVVQWAHIPESCHSSCWNYNKDSQNCSKQ